MIEWTERKRERLRKMVLSKQYNRVEIAMAFGVSYGAIDGQMSKMGLTIHKNSRSGRHG